MGAGAQVLDFFFIIMLALKKFDVLNSFDLRIRDAIPVYQ